ncbi:predicted protein [Mycobacterium tuberculosis T17]|nr:predicted protein [Mycobacterium tuberculosis T17]
MGGESPRARDDYPDGQAELTADHRGLQLTVTQLDDLGANAVNPQSAWLAPAVAAADNAASANCWRGRSRKSSSIPRFGVTTPP